MIEREQFSTQKTEPKATVNNCSLVVVSPYQENGNMCLARFQNCYEPENAVGLHFSAS